MPHEYRFYIPPHGAVLPELHLPPDEAHHAIHVVRIRRDEQVSLFDGQGTEIDAVVTNVTKREVHLQPIAHREHAEPSPKLTLAQGWLHRDKPTEFLIRRATELGVNRIVFFRARHSEKKPRINPKWQRILIEVCKQCNRSWLPTLHVAENLEEVLDANEGDLLITTSHAPPVPLAQCATDHELTLLVGPEGDFSDAEVAGACSKGAHPLSLGDTIFRAEVAATHALSLIQFHRGNLGPQ